MLWGFKWYHNEAQGLDEKDHDAYSRAPEQVIMDIDQISLAGPLSFLIYYSLVDYQTHGVQSRR